MSLNFKDWLRIEEESMTSTGSIANVPMRLGMGGCDILRRRPASILGDEKKKKGEKKPE